MPVCCCKHSGERLCCVGSTTRRYLEHTRIKHKVLSLINRAVSSALCNAMCRNYQGVSYVYWTVYRIDSGGRGGAVVKVLCYKSEDRLFDPTWCHWNFSLKQSF